MGWGVYVGGKGDTEGEYRSPWCARSSEPGGGKWWHRAERRPSRCMPSRMALKNGTCLGNFQLFTSVGRRACRPQEESIAVRDCHSLLQKLGTLAESKELRHVHRVRLLVCARTCTHQRIVYNAMGTGEWVGKHSTREGPKHGVGQCGDGEVGEAGGARTAECNLDGGALP